MMLFGQEELINLVFILIHYSYYLHDGVTNIYDWIEYEDILKKW